MSQAPDVANAVDAPGHRRPSIEKLPILSGSDFEDDDDDEIEPTAFNRLPEEIIQQILEAADPNSFASLVLLNSKWRNASQQGHLYATQLMRCSSYSASHKKDPDGKQENLPALRKLFAREVKRNLFDAYLRPNHTMIKLLSNSISSSSCPGGDGMSFSPSPKGHYLLAYNSSRIHIIDLRRPTISVERELKILRRPVATCIKDDGSLLAVLLTEMQVDLYDLTQTPPRRSQTIILDHSPRAIALSPCGSVLAAAYEGGIEVQSLNPGALATDKRSVKCDAVDALAFSYDGTQILGTTVHSTQPNTVILTAPYYDPGASLSNDSISALWTTSILFPNTSRDCSHAVLIQESSQEEASWAFTYDRSFETFRAVRIDDLRNGTHYFTGPISNTPSKLLPCTLPSASYNGDLVSAGFQGKEIWLYGVPEDLETVPDASHTFLEANDNSGGVYRSVSSSSMRSRPRTQDAGERRVPPQWQLLCDKYRNTFVGGFKAAELSGVSTVKWVAGLGESSLKERLVIAAKGATPPKPITTEEDGMDFEDGGRLTLVDFDYKVEDGCVTEVTIEVGSKEPEILEEEHRDLETEVAIVRRRTVAQRRGNRSAIMRAATTAAGPTHAEPNENDDDDDPLLPRRVGAMPDRSHVKSMVIEDTETEAIFEEHEALDGPYSQTGPRSTTTLRRAATAAANHRRLNPTTSTGARIEYRRADGRAEHPHESDADKWEPPPPPYMKDDPGDAPAFLRHSMLPAVAMTQPQSAKEGVPPVPSISRNAPRNLPRHLPSPQQRRERRRPTTLGASAQSRSRSRSSGHQTCMPDKLKGRCPRDAQATSHQRFSSYPTVSTPGTSSTVAGTRTAGGVHVEEDIYNVSPPDTPRPRGNDNAERQTSETNASAQRGTMESVAAPVGASHDSHPSPASSSTVYTGTQRVIPLVPRTQAPSVKSSRTPGQQSHTEGSISGTSSSVNSTRNPHVGENLDPRPVVHSQTWPTPSLDTSQPSAAPTEYLYSAPATTIAMGAMKPQSNPPAPPFPEEDSNHNDGRKAELSRRTSSGFQPPRRRTEDRSDERGPLSALHLLPGADSLIQGLHESQQAQFHIVPHTFTPYTQAGVHSADDAQVVPDQPLIISTPTGVQGAFDAPSDEHSDRRRVEQHIIAPVPRHPRGTQRSELLRPEDRIGNDYALAGPNLMAATPSSAPTSRISPLNRRPSRAERSAARNMAEAKKKGWRPGRSKSKKASKKKKREPECDVVSQSAWTDVTWDESGSRARSRMYHNHGGLEGRNGDKDKKCVVM